MCDKKNKFHLRMMKTFIQIQRQKKNYGNQKVFAPNFTEIIFAKENLLFLKFFLDAFQNDTLSDTWVKNV